MSGLAGSSLFILRALTVPLFVFGAIHDYRHRTVPNWLWWPGLALAGVIYVVGGPWDWPSVAIHVGGIWLLALGLWYWGGVGGGDAKAMMVLALIFPSATFTYTVILLAVVMGVVYVTATKQWDDPNVPFLVPLTMALILALLPVVLYPFLPA